MKTAALLLVLSTLATAASAQDPDWSHARRIDIALSNFKYEPAVIGLEHGKPYVLHLVNTAGGRHNFVAKRFFTAAMIASADRPAVSEGELEIEGGESADVRLIAPAAGSYEVHCSHFMHTTFGMTGRIDVR